jgi:hypothetical protein
MFCSVAGALFVIYSQSAYPELLDWTQSGYAVFMVVIGGMFTFLGPALGALVYTLGQQYLVAHTTQWQLILGAVLVLIALFWSDGLAGLFGLAGRRLRRPGLARPSAADRGADAGAEQERTGRSPGVADEARR